MITYQKEYLKDIREEASQYFQDHYNEVEYFTDEIEFTPDWKLYDALEDAQSLKCYTVRDNEVLVGYLIYIINPILHMKDKFSAQSDAIYIQQCYRGGTIAYDLLCFAEDDLYTLDIFTITMNMKNKARFETLMKSLNYNKTEIVYSKFIGEQ